ncbi:MAG: tRNA 4-thiouridine(8) synthase ThiI, partial [Lachnospiraceae bacterium]|nr:tRNA 4-thiouridine(8) synthase ThiI [Lachnospiraceae bacterium]
MNYKTFLIKYAEIGLKGKNRYVFEDALVKQINRALKKIEGDFEVKRTEGRVTINVTSESYDFDETIAALQTVFGITGICPVVVVEKGPYEELSKEVVKYVDEVYPDKNKTFKVFARRAHKNYPLDSMELNKELGHDILEAFPEFKVDVHKPDIQITVEVRDVIYIYSEIIPGPGGMPLGTNGRAMLLLSGGIDSPVAGYMIAKRGVVIDAVYFHAPPYTSERAKQKVVDLAKLISKYTGP